MELQTYFNAAVTIFSILGGALLKSVYDAIRDLRKEDGEIHERINKMPSVYKRRDDSSAFETRIEAALVRIEAKLDGKADK